jgi:hypothetical protein
VAGRKTSHLAQSLSNILPSVSITETTQLMLFKEIIAVYCEHNTNHFNILCGENVEFFYVILKQVVRIVTTVL